MAKNAEMGTGDAKDEKEDYKRRTVKMRWGKREVPERIGKGVAAGKSKESNIGKSEMQKRVKEGKSCAKLGTRGEQMEDFALYTLLPFFPPYGLSMKWSVCCDAYTRSKLSPLHIDSPQISSDVLERYVCYLLLNDETTEDLC